MRSAPLAVLAAAAFLAAGCGGSEPAPSSPASESVIAYVWDRRPLLVLLDPVTLRARSRGLDLGRAPVWWARSPRRDRLAFGSANRARVTIVDLQRMRLLSTIDLGRNGYVAGLAWPTNRRIVAAVSGSTGEIAVVDPVVRRVVRRHRVRGTVTRSARFPGGLVLLLSPRDGIGRATLAVATPARLRTTVLPLETGADPPAVSEPGLAVSPDGRRALVAPAGVKVVEVDLRTLEVAERELAEPVSLLGRLRSWLDPAAYAKGPLEGAARSATWMAGGGIVVTGSNYRPLDERSMVSEAAGLRLIESENWSVRTLADAASEAIVAGDTVLAFGGTRGSAGLRGIGLRGFHRDGRERFHLFGDRYVAVVTAVGRYAYVSEQSETQTRIEVVELTSGRVIRTVRKPTYTNILQLG